MLELFQCLDDPLSRNGDRAARIALVRQQQALDRGQAELALGQRVGELGCQLLQLLFLMAVAVWGCVVLLRRRWRVEVPRLSSVSRSQQILCSLYSLRLSRH